MEKYNGTITMASKDDNLIATHRCHINWQTEGFIAQFEEKGEGYTTFTTINFDGSFCVIERVGDIASKMLFVENQITDFTYGIKEGEFEGKIATEKLAVYKTESKFMLVISYGMAFGDEKFAPKRTRITIKED